MKEKKFGYACVSSAFIPRTDPEALKGTKAYHALEDTFRFMKLPPENLYIDLLSPNYRRRKNLEVILDTAKPGDIVIVASVSALGFSPEEVKKTYYRYRQKVHRTFCLGGTPEPGHSGNGLSQTHAHRH